MPLGYFFTSDGMSKQACVTLHLPPPLTLTFDSNLLVFSTMITFSDGLIRAALTAQKKPAAPPPITIKVLEVCWGEEMEPILA